MKKSLLAVAAMTAFAGAAQAQSSVTVFGNMDGAYTATENKTTTTAGAVTNVKGRNSVNGDGALSTSVFGVRGTEDLGGGMKANFYLELDLANIGTGGNGNDVGATGQTTTVNAGTGGFGARYSWIGVASSLGEVRMGRQAQAVHGAITNGLAGGGNNIAGSLYSKGQSSALNSATIRPQAVFVDQAITYISPKAAGFQGQIQTSQNAYSGSDTTQSVGATETGGSITYDGIKDLTVAYGYAVNGVVVLATSYVKTTTQALSANYNFGAAQVFALAAQRKLDNNLNGVNTADTKSYEIGVKAPVSPVIGVWASTFTGNRDSGLNNVTTVAADAASKADMSGFQLGTTYSFSKRTTAYAIYGSQQIKGKGTSSGAKIESTGYALGLRHNF